MKLQKYRSACLLRKERRGIHCGHFVLHAPACGQQALSPILRVPEVRGEVQRLALHASGSTLDAEGRQTPAHLGKGKRGFHGKTQPITSTSAIESDEEHTAVMRIVQNPTTWKPIVLEVVVRMLPH